MKKYEKYLLLRNKNFRKYRIIKELDITERTYYNYLKKYKNGLRSSKKLGRKPILSPDTKKYIRNLISRCKYQTTKDIHQKCINLGKKSSISSISKYLRSINYHHRKEKKAPFISKRNKSKRLAFCIKYYNFDFKRIISIDECHFINVPLCGDYFWSKGNERKKIGVSKNRLDVSIFGAISYYRKYPLLFYKGRLNAIKYRAILLNYIQKFRKMEKQPFYLQHDNAPCHNGKQNLSYFNSLGINFIKHPPSSPDINGIENVWGEIKKSVLKKTYSNEESLIKKIKEEWSKYDIKKFQCLKKNGRKD